MTKRDNHYEAKAYVLLYSVSAGFRHVLVSGIVAGDLKEAYAVIT